MKFNAGCKRTSAAILQELHLTPGIPSARMVEKDRRRAVASANKRKTTTDMQNSFKKRHLGGRSQSDYIPGGF